MRATLSQLNSHSATYLLVHVFEVHLDAKFNVARQSLLAGLAKFSSFSVGVGEKITLFNRIFQVN